MIHQPFVAIPRGLMIFVYKVVPLSYQVIKMALELQFSSESILFERKIFEYEYEYEL